MTRIREEIRNGNYVLIVYHFSDIQRGIMGWNLGQGQAHRKGGVAGASALGVLREPGGPPQKNLSWCEKRWKRAGRNGEVKNCSSDTICLQLPSGIKDLPRAAGWLSKFADRTKIRRKQGNKIILKEFSSELYPCTVLWFWILAKFVSTPHWKQVKIFRDTKCSLSKYI